MDGITADKLAGAIVGWARQYKRDEVDAYGRYVEYRDAGDYPASGGWHKKYLAMRSLAGAVVHPLRIVYSERTRDERIEAILARDVRMVEIACGGETCPDCDRPLWMHVTYNRTVYAPDHGVRAAVLCPFGRRYWHFSRAATQEWTDAERYAMARSIARETRRDVTVPVWKPAAKDLVF